ncbi:hypothetical protein KC340_g52 [Hortaea werneckii]|nr:hypothetical protein KC340_g52 [Hortaea werneckii]
MDLNPPANIMVLHMYGCTLVITVAWVVSQRRKERGNMRSLQRVGDRRRKHFDPTASLTQTVCTCVFDIEPSTRLSRFIPVVVGRASIYRVAMMLHIPSKESESERFCRVHVGEIRLGASKMPMLVAYWSAVSSNTQEKS